MEMKVIGEEYEALMNQFVKKVLEMPENPHPAPSYNENIYNMSVSIYPLLAIFLHRNMLTLMLQKDRLNEDERDNIIEKSFFEYQEYFNTYSQFMEEMSNGHAINKPN